MFWGKRQEPYLDIREKKGKNHKKTLPQGFTKIKRKCIWDCRFLFNMDTYKPKVMTITMIYKTCAQV
jgi:hypothetical protein